MRASRSQHGNRTLALLFAVAVLAGFALPQAARAQNLSEEIQRERDDNERKRREYLAEKATAEAFNTRVERYKDLRETVPFASVPGTTNLLLVYVNRQDLRAAARQLYDITDGATDAGFERDYWSIFLRLNQYENYDVAAGVPIYTDLEAERHEDNAAVFLNIRKLGMTSALAELNQEDWDLAKQLTDPVVRSYEGRLREHVKELAELYKEVPGISGPERLPGVYRLGMFDHVRTETRDVFPMRPVSDPNSIRYDDYVDGKLETNDVDINAPLTLEPQPTVWAMRQGVNMLGDDYAGYDVAYEPSNFELQPEGGAMAFYGGRTALGERRTQLGLYFSFNQKLFKLLVLNQTAFAAFSSGEAPAINGGVLNAGLDIDFGYFSIAGMGGLAAVNVVGETETGIGLTGRVRIPLGQSVSIGAIWMGSNVSVFRGQSPAGVDNAGFAGLSLTIR